MKRILAADFDRPAFFRTLLALAFLILAANAAILLIQPSRALDEDLGWHIRIGELIWETRSLPVTNFFTYTVPDAPFLTQHWLAATSFYLVADAFGLIALSVLKVLLLGGALGLSFWSAIRLGGPLPTLISASAFMPLILERNTERPEIFAFFLFSLLFFLLFASRFPLRGKCFAALAVLLLWVNFHITFVYGLLLILLFALQTGATNAKIPIPGKWHWRNPAIGWLYVLLFAAPLVTLLNPNGLAGAVYPFTVFQNYDYEITENLGAVELLKILIDPYIYYFILLAPLAALFVTYAIWKTRKWHWAYVLFFTFMLLTFLKVRTVPYFLFSGIPVIAYAFGTFSLPDLLKSPKMQSAAAGAFILAHIALSLLLFARIPPRLEIIESGKAGVDVFLEAGLPGNIFNNYDIGNYLNYRLYPNHRPFVDNRPEAYPPGFFAEYKAIQMDPKFRKSAFARYKVNSVIFSKTDITPWARTFLLALPADPEWETAYNDDFLVIFTRKTPIPL